ncbi:platelet endothelial aggregation receptor 1-like [Haliotis rubra]|uniref:platelet endothelial aggregation receptor 1-like n=1 Tax=Haliotis rubra TaxID=36100 RepID=UPI001EE63587|nr:platelet endothelial aggregation receptor 1-like [Haliotis rubra]
MGGLGTMDLGMQYRIHDVKIYQPLHEPEGIRSCVLYLSNTSSSTGLPCYAFPYDTRVSNGGIYSATCDGIGRYFSISNATYLNLCEVEIYVCSPGLFGETCCEFCHCAEEACDRVSGLCPGDCRPGWQGNRCDTGSCPAGKFGDSCSYSCHCGQSCNQTTGVCGGGCDEGWVGGHGIACQKG